MSDTPMTAKVIPSRPQSGETLTVVGLMRELAKYDPNLPVIATWEGQAAGILPGNMAVEPMDAIDQLVIDVGDTG